MASREFTLHHSWERHATIGFLGATTPSIWSAFVAAFEQRLRELGWINGRNIAIDYRWAEGRQDRYAGLAQDLVRSKVDIIVTSGTAPAMAVAKATTVIPIVFAAAGAPKLVTDLARGRNVTGLWNGQTHHTRTKLNGQTNLPAQRIDYLRKVVPGLRRLAIIGNCGSRNIPLEMGQLQKSARKFKIDTVICDVRRAAQITPTIKRLRGKADALFVCTDPFITTNQIAINIAAVSARLPTMHAFRDYVEMGGLMSYGPDFRAMFRGAAVLVDKILRGAAQPADLPIKLQKQCELVINQNTANALGISIPKGVRGRAKVIR
jgi:putative tryptophan/tyrosine transport system substrate-binding protein